MINDVNGSLSNPENLKLILYFPFLYGVSSYSSYKIYYSNCDIFTPT